MDPITIAMALAQFAPAIIRWISGSDEAGKVAQDVVSVATKVTGASSPEEALARIQADAQLQVQFRTAMMEHEARMDAMYLKDRQDARARDVEFVRAGKENRRANLMLALAFVAVIAIAALLALGRVDGASAVGGFLITVGGMFARNIGTAFDFEFGSSRGSREKDDGLAEAIRQLAAKKTP